MQEEKVYDNTDRGTLYSPRQDQKMMGIGKIQDGSEETFYVLVKQQTQQGEEYINIFKNIGTIYKEDRNDNPNYPNFKGYFGDRRVSMWITNFPEHSSQSGKSFLSVSIQDKYEANVAEMENDKPKDKDNEAFSDQF